MYQQDRAACNSGQTNQDRATCLREAGAALQESRRGRLDNGQSSLYEQNALARCQPLPLEERAACQARIRGEGTTSGSVEKGGVYRELTVIEQTPAEPSAMPPRPMPMPPESTVVPSTPQ